MVTMSNAYEEPRTYYGLSEDTKPALAPNGSLFVEMDTSTLYLFDEAGAQWLEWGVEDA